MRTELKVLHDRLLDLKPDGAAHAAETCPLCADIGGQPSEEEPEGGRVSEQTYTEAELKAAVDRAVAEATSELQQKAQLESAVAAAKAEAEEQIKGLQAKLDAAVLEATSEREQREAVEAAQRAAEEKAAREAEIAARRDSRLTQIREVANFPDEYLVANGDRFAAMSDEDFTRALEDWKAIAARTEAPPATSALQAARSETPKSGSVLREVLSFRSQGIDPRKL